MYKLLRVPGMNALAHNVQAIRKAKLRNNSLFLLCQNEMTDNSKTSIACCDSHTQLMAAMTCVHIQAAFSWGLLACLFYRGRVKDLRKGMSVQEEWKLKSEQQSQITSVHWMEQRGPFQRGLLDLTVLCCKKKNKNKSIETKLYVSESTQ